MKILYVTSNGVIASIADDFVFGESDEVGVDKWHEVRNGEQVPHLYYLGDFDSAVVNDLPEDILTYGGKYLFINGEIVLNPDWHEPEPPIEERVSTLEDNITNIELALTDIVDLLSE